MLPLNIIPSTDTPPNDLNATAVADRHNSQSTAGLDWDLVLRPHDRLFRVDLGDLWRYRDLIYLFVRRDFVSQFTQTILGPAWFVLNPLLSTLMFTVIFGNVARLSTDGVPQIAFYMSGTILWEYFAACLGTTSNTFAANAHLFGKVYFPRLAVPISVCISQGIRFVLQFAFFLCFWAYFAASGAHVPMNATALLFPLLVLLVAGISLGLGLIFSALTTKYRDIAQLLTFAIRLAMYAAPVVYPLSMIHNARYRLFILANPITPIIETFRYGFLGSGTFSWMHLGYSALFTVLAIFAGAIMFNRTERTFMDTV